LLESFPGGGCRHRHGRRGGTTIFLGMMKLIVPPGAGYLRCIRTFVESIGKSLGLPSRIIYQLKGAVDEICSNIFEHGATGPLSLIQIYVSREHQAIRIIVADTGRSFDWNHIPSPSVEELSEHGWGIYLIKKFVDKIEYAVTPTHNEFQLMKYLEGDDAVGATSIDSGY